MFFFSIPIIAVKLLRSRAHPPPEQPQGSRPVRAQMPTPCPQSSFGSQVWFWPLQLSRQEICRISPDWILLRAFYLIHPVLLVPRIFYAQSIFMKK